MEKLTQLAQVLSSMGIRTVSLDVEFDVFREFQNIVKSYIEESNIIWVSAPSNSLYPGFTIRVLGVMINISCTKVIYEKS